MRQKVELINDQESIAEILNDCSIDRVMAIDLQWRIIAWNRSSELVSGLSKTDVIGRVLMEVFPQILADEEMLTAIKDAFDGKKSFLPSNLYSFNRQYSENHFIPLRQGDGRVIGVMNLMHDVALRIKVEKQLQKLNNELEKRYQQLEKANRELATFTYISSRDIKEPLKHVYTSLELLIKKEAASLSNMSKGNLRRMQGSLNKINLLLDDILTVSGIGSNNESLETINLDEIINVAKTKLKTKAEESNSIINVEPLPEIQGYRKMLEYLFVNLIDNAIKFQPPDAKPSISISGSIGYGDEFGLQLTSADKKYLKISFSDNGIGFDQKDAGRIFNLFEKLNDRQFHGSGIGLTISKKIAEAHEGFIIARSEPGNGATFECYFPVDED